VTATGRERETERETEIELAAESRHKVLDISNLTSAMGKDPPELLLSQA